MKIYEIISERLAPTNNITTNIKKSIASNNASFNQGSKNSAGSNPDNQYATLVGRRSKTWNKNSNTIARQNHANGMSADENWSLTGNVLDPGGRWRQEVHDGDAKFTGVVGDGSLGVGLDHEELLKAYPNLANYGLDTNHDNSDNKRIRGSFQKNTMMNKNGMVGDIKIGKLAPGGIASNKTKLKTTGHELQHAVDDIEGYAPGGSSSSDTTKKLAKANNMSDYDFYKTYAGELMGRENARRWNMSRDERKKIVPTFPDSKSITTPDGKGGWNVKPNHWNSTVNKKVVSPTLKPNLRPNPHTTGTTKTNRLTPGTRVWPPAGQGINDSRNWTKK